MTYKSASGCKSIDEESADARALGELECQVLCPAFALPGSNGLSGKYCFRTCAQQCCKLLLLCCAVSPRGAFRELLFALRCQLQDDSLSQQALPVLTVWN